MQSRNSAGGGVRIGTAGWSIPRDVAACFPSKGSGLERYAGRFQAVEINSTFYKSHRPATYARWAAAAPPDFRFAMKLPRAITHVARLEQVEPLLASFCAEASQLQDRAGPLLVQLPPGLDFDPTVAEAFFKALGAHWAGRAVCEPRHPEWFGIEANALLRAHQIARVAADPPPHPAAAEPGGWEGMAYWRLHGSPRTYYSAYDDKTLKSLAPRLTPRAERETWCVFDNTASGAAAANALTLQAMLRGGRGRPPSG